MRLPLLLLALVALSGCQPEIGDSCDVDSDCSQSGERICDSTQPGGYCTIFGCDPSSCPEDESVCVAFGNTPSVVSGCESSNGVSPYVRNFCMKKCSGNGDCRTGYVCWDMSLEGNPWGADVITNDPPTTKVCVYPYSGEEILDNPDAANGSNYCSASGMGGFPGSSSGSLGGASSGGESPGGASPGGMSGLGGAQ